MSGERPEDLFVRGAAGDDVFRRRILSPSALSSHIDKTAMARTLSTHSERPTLVQHQRMVLHVFAEVHAMPCAPHVEYSPAIRGLVGAAVCAVWDHHDTVSADEFESWFERGVTDGLPVVPPTRERVERMLGATRRDRTELLGEMPPNYGRLTVEKAAINAVMAGCRPEYLPVVLAAAQAACDPAFNLHGVATSTHFAAPLIVVNGPIRARIGLNASFGVFGPGFRANATIGRALRLLIGNVGGARPGELSMSTFGHPGRYTYCIAEHEEASPWPPYQVSRGLGIGTSAVTLFAGDAPHGISDHASRTAQSLAGSLGWSMAGLWNSKHFPLYSHTMLVVGPEHARTLADGGWSREDLTRYLYATIRVPYRTLLPDGDHGEGTNLRFAKWPPDDDQMVSKFPSPEEIHVIVAGGTAGRFSVAVPGWLGTRNGSRPITRAIEMD